MSSVASNPRVNFRRNIYSKLHPLPLPIQGRRIDSESFRCRVQTGSSSQDFSNMRRLKLLKGKVRPNGRFGFLPVRKGIGQEIFPDLIRLRKDDRPFDRIP